MLLAGLVCSIISLRQGVDLMSFTTRLLTVLVVFYIIGAILKVILSCAFYEYSERFSESSEDQEAVHLRQWKTGKRKLKRPKQRLMIPKSLIMIMTMISQLASCRIIYW